MVPIHITAGSAHAKPGSNDDGGALATFNVLQYGFAVASGYALDNGFGGGQHSFATDGEFSFSTAFPLLVSMQTQISCTTSDVSHGTASATIDPTFTIDDPYYAPPNPGIAYAAAIAAYVSEIDTGAEPKVPPMTDDGRSRPLMTRAEFIAAIEARPRVPAPGEEDDGSAPPTLSAEGCRPTDALGEENDFSARS